MLKNGYLQIITSFVKKMSYHLWFVTDSDPWFSNKGTNFQIGKHALSKKKSRFYKFSTYLLRDVLSICRTLISQIRFPMVLAPKVKDRVAMSPGRFPRSTYTYEKKRELFSRSSFLEAGKEISSVHHFVIYVVRTYTCNRTVLKI